MSGHPEIPETRLLGVKFDSRDITNMVSSVTVTEETEFGPAVRSRAVSAPGEVLLRFPPPAPIMSMNDRGFTALRLHSALWRDAAHLWWVAAWPGVGPSGRAMPPSEVFTSLPFFTRGRRDPINFAPTVKHIVDGITTAGAWPDDVPEWVTQHLPTLRVNAGADVIVRVVPRAPETGSQEARDA